jgi:type 1 glutamine amidotransferase
MTQTGSLVFLLCPIVLLLVSIGQAETKSDYKTIFDGTSLNGWDGNPQVWSVEDGALTAQSTAKQRLKKNSFLIWRGGAVADFDLRLKFRIEGGNGGIQYRSQEVGKWLVAGYQADIDAENRYTGMLYDEAGRGILAKRGERAAGAVGKERQVAETFEVAAAALTSVERGEWNEYRIVAVGTRMLHFINGTLTADFLDGDKDHADSAGILALQIHAGPPTKVQYKDIRLKTIDETNRPAEARIDGSDLRRKTHRIVFVAGTKSHQYGAHEHNAGCLLLAKELERACPTVKTDVYRNGWPKEADAFEKADTVVMFCDGGPRHVVMPHVDDFQQVMKRGTGLVCLHYAVEIPKGGPGDRLLSWLGGYFETGWSVNPHWTAEFTSLPDHPIANGVSPFAVNDEWYFHMRFPSQMKGVTPILSAVPPLDTMKRPDGPHEGNPAVRKAVGERRAQHVAWAFENEFGGRAFGFTGAHFHWNWGDDNFRRIVLNAILWTAKHEVPPQGIGLLKVDRARLEQNQDDPPPVPKP